MKARLSFFAVLVIFVLSFFPNLTFSGSNDKIGRHSGKNESSVYQNEKGSKGDYKYVRVFKDGIWWIYVYDGSVLIDVYPE